MNSKKCNGQQINCYILRTRTTKHEVHHIILFTAPVGASQRQPNSKWQNVLIALTVSLPIMCLIGGFAAGFIYHRYRSNRSNTSHLDELSERKHKKMIDRSDSDTYQEMPKLHIHNNFTAKSNNALGKSPDTTTPVGPGESTLARTKKSYV